MKPIKLLQDLSGLDHDSVKQIGGSFKNFKLKLTNSKNEFVQNISKIVDGYTNYHVKNGLKSRLFMFDIIIDVSGNNGVIDWNQVANNNGSRIKGVMIKTSEGSGYSDANADLNINDANKNGIPIGLYHFAFVSTLDLVNGPVAEATFFASKVNNYKDKLSLPVALDFEVDRNLDPTGIKNWISSFINTFKSLCDYELIIYSYWSFLMEKFPSDGSFSDMKLWLAAYVEDINKLPGMPKSWPTAWMWQYSDTEKVVGVNGNVDASIVMTQQT